MTTNNSQPRCLLQETIRLGKFFIVDEATILTQIKEAFEPELERLKSARAVEGNEKQRQQAGPAASATSPSQILYGVDYDEINRTLVGILALRWIRNGDYERFTRGQPAEYRLAPDSFSWLCDLFADGVSLKCTEDLFALVLSMVINDLGKDPNLEQDFVRETHSFLPEQNHDSLLLEAAKAGMIPSLGYLSPENREEVMLGLDLGSELNAGQLAQGESVPINLEGLLNMRGHEHAFELKFMEQVLDVAGAAGHLDATGAKNLIEPVFQAFKIVHEVSLDIIAGKSSLREGYDRILIERGNMLSGKGFRKLSVHDRKDRALLRLLAMGRTADKEQAEWFSKAFDALDDADKDKLIDGLNIDGNNNETAILPYYMPAIISTTLENTKDADEENKCRALTSIMRYLAKVLNSHDGIEQAKQQRQNNKRYSREVPGIVIEMNMSKAQEVINSAGFKDNPELLDVLDVPAGQVLQRRRTSQTW